MFVINGFSISHEANAAILCLTYKEKEVPYRDIKKT